MITVGLSIDEMYAASVQTSNRDASQHRLLFSVCQDDVIVASEYSVQNLIKTITIGHKKAKNTKHVLVL